MKCDAWGFPLAKGWPEIDRAGIAEVDRLMIGRCCIVLEQLMENAGRALALVEWRRFLAHGPTPCVTILAGVGGGPLTAVTLSLDVPSWFDASTGQAMSPAVLAAATVTLALPKKGLQAPVVRPSVGDLYLLTSRCRPASITAWTRRSRRPRLPKPIS